MGGQESIHDGIRPGGEMQTNFPAIGACGFALVDNIR
jgi:hypothetical protein